MDTTDKVGELEALLAKATPGPLSQCGGDRGGCACGMVFSEPADAFVADFSLSSDDETRHHRVDADTRKANAALYVAAVNALPELLRVYRAWQGAAVGECSAAGRMELDGDSVCGFFISTSADELRRNPFGQRVRLVPDDVDAQGGAG